MNMNESTSIEVSIYDAERLLYGIQRTTEALTNDILSFSTEGVLRYDKNASTGKTPKTG